MINFEVYEGKDAMAKKEFVGDKTDLGAINKSTALTLRCVKPYFGSGKVLIADSWFGSVACTLELFRRGMYAIMNVKTGCAGYPKDELLKEVEEIKGNSVEARAARRARRGKQVAFVKKFKVGSRECIVLAAGHNRKVPLLLVGTASSMVPGNMHVKRWTTPNAAGEIELHEIRTKQPEMHELYQPSRPASADA